MLLLQEPELVQLKGQETTGVPPPSCADSLGSLLTLAAMTYSTLLLSKDTLAHLQVSCPLSGVSGSLL